MSSELISVIIPTYSRSEMLPRAINSVLEQTYENFEIIVVDDNGVGTVDQLATHESISDLLVNPRVRYITNPKNLGGSRARNAGIEASSGQYITFLDDDDEYYIDKLEKQLTFYKNHFLAEDGFINGQIDVVKFGKKVKTTKSTVDYDNLLFSAVSENILGTPTFFMPKKILSAMGGFPIISKGQEWYLSVKLIEAGYSFRSMTSAIVKVNIHDQGSIFDGNLSNKNQLDGLNKIFSIQKEYFNHFSKKQQRYIKYRYCLAIARAHSKKSTKLSIHWLFKSLLYSLPKKDFLATLFRVIFK